MRALGFTLVEVLIAVGIFALLAAAVAPSMVGFLHNREAEGIMTQMVQTMRYTQQQAVLKRKVHSFVIDIDHGSYWVMQPIDPNAKDDRRRDRKRSSWDDKERGLEKAHPGKLPDGYQFGSVYYVAGQQSAISGETAVHFFEDGTATGAALLVQRLKSERSDVREYALRVEHPTGRIREMGPEERVEIFGN